MILVNGLDFVWDREMERTRKPHWHAWIPSTRFLRERLFDWAGSREYDIVKKAHTFTQWELEDYYVDVVETQVREHLGHPLRSKDSVFLRFAIALELETAAAGIPYRLTFARCLRLYKAHDGHKQQDCEDIARDAWSRVGWRTPFTHRPKQRKRKTNWELFERCSDHCSPGTSAAEIDRCWDCRWSHQLYMKDPEGNRRIALSKARMARVDDLMNEESSSDDDDDEDADVQVSGMLRRREDADLDNEEYSQLELDDHMMSEEAQLALFLSFLSGPVKTPARCSSEEDDADDEDEEEDNHGDMLVVPAPQQVKPTVSAKVSPRYAYRNMDIRSMIQQELVDDNSEEEAKQRRRQQCRKRDAENAIHQDEMLLKREKMRISMDAANAEMEEWHTTGRGRRLERSRKKRKRENIQGLVETGLVSEIVEPKRVRFALL